MNEEIKTVMLEIEKIAHEVSDQIYQYSNHEELTFAESLMFDNWKDNAKKISSKAYSIRSKILETERGKGAEWGVNDE